MQPASRDHTQPTWNFSEKTKALPVKNRRGKMISSGKAKSRISFLSERCADREKNFYAIAVKTFSKQQNCRLGIIEKRFYFLCLVDGEHYKVNKQSLKKRFNPSEDFKFSKEKDLVALAGSVLLTTEGTEGSGNSEPQIAEQSESSELEVSPAAEANEPPSAGEVEQLNAATPEGDLSWMVAKFEEYFPEKSLKCGELLSSPKYHYEVEEIFLKNAKTGLEENAMVFSRATNDGKVAQLFVLDSKSNRLGFAALKEEVYLLEGNKISYLNIQSFEVQGAVNTRSSNSSKQTNYQNLLSYFFYKIREFALKLGFDSRVSLSANSSIDTFWYSHGFRYLSCSLVSMWRDYEEPSKEKCKELDEIVRKEKEGTYDWEKQDSDEDENLLLALCTPLYYAEVSEEVTMWESSKGLETKSARKV